MRDDLRRRVRNRMVIFFAVIAVLILWVLRDIHEEYLISKPKLITIHEESEITSAIHEKGFLVVTASICVENVTDEEKVSFAPYCSFIQKENGKTIQREHLRGRWLDESEKNVVFPARAKKTVECVFELKRWKGDLTVDNMFFH